MIHGIQLLYNAKDKDAEWKNRKGQILKVMCSETPATRDGTNWGQDQRKLVKRI